MASNRYVVMGTSPTDGSTVATGAFYDYTRALRAKGSLERKGWLAKVLDLLPVASIQETGYRAE